MPESSRPVDPCQRDVVEMTNGWIKAGALMATLAVVLAVFGHLGMGPYLMTKYEGTTTEVMGESVAQSGHAMRQIEKATWIQLAHSLAIIATGVLMLLRPRGTLRLAQWCFLVGVLTYCSGQYGWALLDQPAFSYLAYGGALVLILGWLALVEGACPGCRAR